MNCELEVICVTRKLETSDISRISLPTDFVIRAADSACTGYQAGRAIRRVRSEGSGAVTWILSSQRNHADFADLPRSHTERFAGGEGARGSRPGRSHQIVQRGCVAAERRAHHRSTHSNLRRSFQLERQGSCARDTCDITRKGVYSLHAQFYRTCIESDDYFFHSIVFKL